MKKIVAIVTVILFVLTSCESGDIIGGRYYGTFHNMSNNKREMGSVSFKYSNKGGETYFLMNDLVTMSQVGEKRFEGAATGSLLNDLIKTMPAIDSIQVCDPEGYISSMMVTSEFMGNSVKTLMTFSTNTQEAVEVEFIGYYQ
jgi:hypothetical protein